MFDNLKLEKGLYNLSGKTFSEALEENDPSENYIGTPLESLDAYERQLKRFNIKLHGENCDKVEKFFTTTDTAVLFPEYVKRCILQGIEDSNIGELVAIKTIIDTTMYRGLDITDDASYDNVTNPCGVITDSTIYEPATTYDIKKLARIIKCPYEVVRQQKLDLLAIQFRVIGRKIGLALYGKLLDTINKSATYINTATTTLTYNDLINLFGQFTNYDANIVIASPTICAKILQLSEISDHCCCNNDSSIKLPFGAKLVKSTALDDTKILAIDNRFAIEYVTTTDIFMETDKLIERQLDAISVSIPFIFRTLVSDAMKMLKITQS